MESVLRRFGLKKGDQRDTEARQRLQKELFAFNRCMEHGFPSKASAIAYDSKLDLMVLGTKTGVLRIYGGPGVELSAHHDDDVGVFQIFTFDQGNIVTLCSDNCLHLWEIAVRDGISYLDEVQLLSLENRVKTVSASCVTTSRDQLLLGSESGHVFTVDLKSFKLLDKVVYQESVIQNAPDDFRVNPGAVEAVVQHPTKPDLLLIGYNRGLIVLWDTSQNKAEQMYNATTQLESLTFIGDGKEFISSHGNGSYVVWNTASSVRPKEQATTPYGPFPCKAISKIIWKSTRTKDPMSVFMGGMPRASYGDHHTVSVVHGNKHVVFDFTSKIIDFFVICDIDRRRRLSPSASIDRIASDDPQALVVLAEEEIVAIDLVSDGWPSYQLPYLASLHSSAITCTAHIANVPQTLWDKLVDAGQRQATGHSARDWPIQGGVNLLQVVDTRDLLITGHEDGSVRFWDVSSTCIVLLYKLTTADMFGGYSRGDTSDMDADEEWPPFRKIGTYDPFSDDPRFAIQKIIMCPLSEILVVGGTAGQVIVLQFERESHQQEMRYVSLNVIGDRDNFVWKGHDALPMRGGDVKYQPGFQPLCIVQMYPPAACTAVTLHSEWQLLAAGTAHGLGLVDYLQRRVVHAKCTLNPAELTGVGESTMSRRKSFKKSLRESFRRLRSRRSDRRRKTEIRDDDPRQRQSPRKPGTNATIGGGGDAVMSSPHRQLQTGGVADDLDLTRPVERQVEARSADDVSGSIVRTLYFADTFLTNAQNHSATLWAGTNAGFVYIYQLHLPADDRRDSETVDCILAKEIHLKHQAPVISICVIDRNAMPLPAPLEVQHECARPPDMTGGHSVVICSEEQLKTFALPSLSTRDKFKLTAHEGSKLRRVGFVNFRSRSDGSYMESDLVCLTNIGEVHVYSIPHLRRQLKSECVSRDNIIGIVSSVFTQMGEGFYLISPSEFSRFSVSAHVVTRPMCAIRRHSVTHENIVAHSDTRRSTPSGSACNSPRRTSPANASNSSRHTELNSTGLHVEGGGEVVTTDALSNSVLLQDDSLVSGDTSVRVHISEESVTTSSVTRTTAVTMAATTTRGAVAQMTVGQRVTTSSPYVATATDQ